MFPYHLPYFFPTTLSLSANKTKENLPFIHILQKHLTFLLSTTLSCLTMFLHSPPLHIYSFPCTQKQFAPSPPHFPKNTETSQVLKIFFPYNKIGILLIHHQNYKNTLRIRVSSIKVFLVVVVVRALRVSEYKPLSLHCILFPSHCFPHTLLYIYSLSSLFLLTLAFLVYTTRPFLLIYSPQPLITHHCQGLGSGPLFPSIPLGVAIGALV